MPISHSENIKISQLSDNILQIALCGDIVHLNTDDVSQKIRQILTTHKNFAVKFVNDNLKKWDSSLILLLYETQIITEENKQTCDYSQMPQNLQDLVKLAFAVNRNPTRKKALKMFWVENLGRKTLDLAQKISDVVGFIGSVISATWRFLTFRSVMRRRDFYAALEDCGPKALGIVSLISFLVGLILAFVGAVQLQTFGAQIYVASLVTIGMCRIMGAIMVGIIMAGRTGSAYAATIGTMQVNEELDALQTMGLSKIEFLVLPRLFAMLISMPILTMLSDFMGMIGGAFIGVFMMNLPYNEYWKYALDAFNLNNFLIGIFHGFCFGFIISLCGCLSGLTCGRDADSVGVATTRSVVRAVVWMIVVTGIITVICQGLGI